MHPAQQVRVARRIGPALAIRVVRAAHLAVQAAHARALAVGLCRIAEGHDGEPLCRAGQPAERVIFVARVLLHSRESSGVQGLDEEGPDTADEGGQ